MGPFDLFNGGFSGSSSAGSGADNRTGGVNLGEFPFNGSGSSITPWLIGAGIALLVVLVIKK